MGNIGVQIEILFEIRLIGGIIRRVANDGGY